MKKTRLGTSDLEVSTFCLGAMPFGDLISGPSADALADRFRERGGNFFDTAHVYCAWKPAGAGCSERELGRYIRDRGCRNEVIVATKGAHPPMTGYRNDPDYLSARRVEADIDESLERLGIDTIDLYWLHRDDPRLGVAEILGILDRERERGRIRAFGASNWTSSRLDEAMSYASIRGMAGFVASQPRFSLVSYPQQTEAKRLEPGALLHLNDSDREWHKASRLAVVPYGPTGNGFFATGGERPDHFRTDENLSRVARVRKLADELGVSQGCIAVTWLLHQPFPVVPILGTTKIEHLDDALAAESVNLSPGQVAWLETGI